MLRLLLLPLLVLVAGAADMPAFPGMIDPSDPNAALMQDLMSIGALETAVTAREEQERLRFRQIQQQVEDMDGDEEEDVPMQEEEEEEEHQVCLIDDKGVTLPNQPHCKIASGHIVAVLKPSKSSTGSTIEVEGDTVKLPQEAVSVTLPKQEHSAEIKALLEDIADKEKVLRSDQEWANKMKAFIRRYKAKVAAVEAYVTKHQVELDRLKASIVIGQKSKQKKELQAKLKKAQGSLTEVEGNHSELSSTVAELTEQLEQLQEVIAHLDKVGL